MDPEHESRLIHARHVLFYFLLFHGVMNSIRFSMYCVGSQKGVECSLYIPDGKPYPDKQNYQAEPCESSDKGHLGILGNCCCSTGLYK